MGNRITRAASHLRADEVQKRIDGEQSWWRRRRWEIVYQALTAPRKAEEIAKTVGVSVATVHQVIASYNQRGVAAIETPGKGGRRRHSLTLEQEQSLLQPYWTRAARGEIATAAEIQQAYEEATKRAAAPSTVYRLLARHGWRQYADRTRPSAAVESTPTHRDVSGVQQRREQTSPRYPSDLTDQEWAILEPLIPRAKPGGRPRAVDMRELINAILYIGRTGCQWRALPRDFAPWSTVWSYFRRWRINGEWERMHTALREQVRMHLGREATPSAAILDSQSVKTTEKGGHAAMTEVKK